MADSTPAFRAILLSASSVKASRNNSALSYHHLSIGPSAGARVMESMSVACRAKSSSSAISVRAHLHHGSRSTCHPNLPRPPPIPHDGSDGFPGRRCAADLLRSDGDEGRCHGVGRRGSYMPKSLSCMSTHLYNIDARALTRYSTGLAEFGCLGRKGRLHLPWEICACRVSAAMAAHALLAGSFYAM